MPRLSPSVLPVVSALRSPHHFVSTPCRSPAPCHPLAPCRLTCRLTAFLPRSWRRPRWPPTRRLLDRWYHGYPTCPPTSGYPFTEPYGLNPGSSFSSPPASSLPWFPWASVVMWFSLLYWVDWASGSTGFPFVFCALCSALCHLFLYILSHPHLSLAYYFLTYSFT